MKGGCKMKKAINFSSKAAYKRWLAYGHMHGDFDVPGNQKIKIRGVPHKVIHTRLYRRKKR